jgi:signal transduction histidine kinase
MRISVRGVTFLGMRPVRAVQHVLQSHPFASDAALASVLAGLVLADVFTSGGYLTGSKWVYVPAGLVMTVPLAWRRRAPFVVLVLVMGSLVVESLILGGADPTPDSQIVPWLVAVYSIAVHGTRRLSYGGAGISLVAGLFWMGVDDFFLPTVLLGGAWLAGRLVQKRQLYASVLEERARVLEQERDANARVFAAEERVRIARELHDVVGHSVSVMVLQAGAERLSLGDDRTPTREALLAIERTGREALAEMSRLLGLLRRPEDDLALVPQPSLSGAETLVQRVRELGVPVELRVEGEHAHVPAGVDLSAYRILQEALTNVVKHAGPARASVVIRYGRRAVEVEVGDDGRGPGNGVGYGIAGMRERVELHGGTLEAGRGDAGGFTVKAWLPLETVAF